jgi:gamma-glutamyltranspeptidase
VPTLLSSDYGKKRLSEIIAEKATADVKQGTPVSSSDTVYLSVVDRWGNACSFINSNYMVSKHTQKALLSLINFYKRDSGLG